MSWLFRAMLLLYPASWRMEYGIEMCRIFEARRRATRGILAILVLWLETFPDLILNAAAVQCDVLVQDIRHSLRALRRSLGFAITAIGIAAVGIGATTATFTLVDNVLLRPLSFNKPDALVWMREDDRSGMDRFWDVSPANYRDWKDMSHSFERMGAYRGLALNITSGHGEPEHLEGASLTWDLWPILGVNPALGRYFREPDDQESAPRTVVLSNGLWSERFGADPSIVGRIVHLEDLPYTVIGVMPKSFYFPTREARLWTPMQWKPDDFADRTNTYVFPMARLKPGVSLEQARAEMRTIGARLSRAYPKELAQTGVFVRRFSDQVSDRSRLMLTVLLAASLCVLLIACTNLASLMLARALNRRRELAVRSVLGAGRERLIRQMLTESLLVVMPGGAFGLLLAYATLPLLVRLVPVSLPMAEVPSMDARVLLLCALLTAATGIIFGIVPAVRSAKQQGGDLREADRSGMGGRRERLRNLLVIVEVAVSVLLLVGFGLLTKALWHIQSVDPGFRSEQVLTLRTALPMPRYETAQQREPFYRHVLEETRQLPGVKAAAYISFLPLAFGGGIWPVEIAGHPEDVSSRRTASLRFVTPGYFAAMGIPMHAGRDVRQGDMQNAPYVALVSRSFVRRYWPQDNPIGRRINIGNQNRTVIGVVGDVRNRGLEGTSEPQVYVSWQQADGASPWYAPKDLVVRTSVGTVSLVTALRRIIHEADATQPITNIRTMGEVMERDTASRKAQLAVLGAFGAVALLLAATGLHGLLAFTVSSRRREIGVRMAVGARQIDILRMTLAEGFRLALIGLMTGLALASLLGRLLQSVLADVKPWDLATIGTAMGVCLLMTFAGGLLPAIRASRVDPTTAIRGS